MTGYKILWCSRCSTIRHQIRNLKKGDLIECIWLDSCLFRQAKHLTRTVYRTEKKTVGYFHSIKDNEYLILISETTDGETYLEGNSLLIRGIVELHVRVPANKTGYRVKTSKKHARPFAVEPIKITQTTEKVILK
ncbi:hypothetical protein KEJ39_04185 [Candidatus Bathyarchaeota archaeon]|nr:hypothetical protein [Candidatus Bathyarchaeota archaeon]